jgi:hypothetical protein
MMVIILKANKVNLFVSSVLFVFWYHSPNFTDTPRTNKGDDADIAHLLHAHEKCHLIYRLQTSETKIARLDSKRGGLMRISVSTSRVPFYLETKQKYTRNGEHTGKQQVMFISDRQLIAIFINIENRPVTCKSCHCRLPYGLQRPRTK